MIALALPAAKLRAALDGTLTEIRSLFFRLDGSRPTYGPGYPAKTCAWEFTVADDGWPEVLPLGGKDFVRAPCPLGAPGALLWIKEPWALEDLADGERRVVWLADRAAAWCQGTPAAPLGSTFYLDSDYEPAGIMSRASMPLWASRLAFRNRGARVEREGDVWTWIAAVERVDRPDGTPMPPREIGGAS